MFYQDREGSSQERVSGWNDGGGIESGAARAQLDLNFSDSVNLLFPATIATLSTVSPASHPAWPNLRSTVFPRRD